MKAFCTLILRDTSYKQKSSEERIVFFWVITQRVVVFFPDVSRQPISPNFVGQESGFLLLKKGPIGCPETSVKITNTRCAVTQKSTALSTSRRKPEITNKNPLLCWNQSVRMSSEVQRNVQKFLSKLANFFLTRLKHKPASCHS
jgi:hypothetical protein